MFLTGYPARMVTATRIPLMENGSRRTLHVESNRLDVKYM